MEHIIVTQGKALVGLTEAPEELAEGDYICYPGDRAHIFKALEPDTQAITVAEQGEIAGWRRNRLIRPTNKTVGPVACATGHTATADKTPLLALR